MKEITRGLISEYIQSGRNNCGLGKLIVALINAVNVKKINIS